MATAEPTTATVFNIQKFSLDDGPGIRTVVFLKGCPLSCQWCANPESQLMAPQVEWDRRACQSCGTCVHGSSCAAFAGTTDDGKPRVKIDHRHVRDATALAGLCPNRALTVSGETRTVDDVLEVCLQDLPFYEESGGGVTISGGEALLWTDFCCELAARLHERGVHVAVETTGYAAPETFARLLDAVDLVLMDVKHWDEDAHRAGTGVGRAWIQANMAAALGSGKEVVFRTPVIPGFNDRAAGADKDTAAGEDGADKGAAPDYKAAAEGLSAVVLAAAREAGYAEAPTLQLLPFHQFGENKYDQLGREYGLHEVKALRHEELEPLVSALVARGVAAFV